MLNTIITKFKTNRQFQKDYFYPVSRKMGIQTKFRNKLIRNFYLLYFLMVFSFHWLYIVTLFYDYALKNSH